MSVLRYAVALSLFTLAAACDSSPSEGARDAPPAASGVAPTARTLSVGAKGYEPSSLSAPAGAPVRLTITRTTDDACGKQIVFPSLDIRKDLPVNQPVEVDFTMPASGSVAFACGMDMMRGTIVAE